MNSTDTSAFSNERRSTSGAWGGQRSSQTTATRKTEREFGLSVEQLVAKVIEIRPDQSASALDMELLKAQVCKDQVLFIKKLKRIEEGVKKALGPTCNIDDEDMP